MTKEPLLFPKEQNLSADFLRSNFWKCNFTSSAKPLQYWILLPNTVKVINVKAIEIEDLKLTSLGQYSSVGDVPYLEVQVIYEHIKYEMNPSDWLLKKLALMGETVMNVREITGKSTGTYLDVLTYRKWPSGDDMVSRFTVFKDSDQTISGANIFCVKATCLEKDYNNYASVILQIVANWDFIHRTDWQLAENLFPFEYKFAENVSFFVPESWAIKFDKDNSDKFSRFLLEHDVVGENKGLINAHFYSLDAGTTLSDIFNKSFSRLSEIQHTISPLMPEKTSNPSILELSTAVGTIIYEEERDAAFLKIYLFKSTGGWYYFEQIGPKPNLENDFWEINKRAIEMILDSFNNLGFLRKESVDEPPVIAKDPEPASTENRWLLPHWKKL